VLTGVGTSVEITVIQSGKIVLKVDQPVVTFEADKQLDAYLTVTGNRTFTAQSSQPEWCSVKVIANAAIGNLKISVNSNEMQADRTATVSLIVDGVESDVTVTVIQLGKTILEVDPLVVTFDAEGNPDAYPTVTSNCPVTVRSTQPSWCNAELLENVTTGNLRISVSRNETEVERTTTILLTDDEEEKEVTVTVIQAGANPSPILNVMTFNIRVASGQHEDPIRWDGGRSTLVKRVIIERGTDIVGTQECEQMQQTYLQNNLIGYQVVGEASGSGTNSIFFKQVRFEMLESGKFWLSETPDKPGSKSWDSGYIRMAVWLKLRDKFTGKQYFVINTHIDHIGVMAQQKQVEVLLQKIEELRAGLPVILTGDFNMRPENANIGVITNSFSHTRDVAQTKEGLDYSYHGYSVTPSNERYLADYIFVSNDFNVDYYSVLPEKLDGNFVSDHAPVLAKLKTKN
jgi:endonuclease/exonuclease/phosphatase family metal-dependent hydrolase